MKLKSLLPSAIRPGRFTLLLAGLAALGAGLILAREASYGVGLASDWAAYISAARNLLDGEWFVQIYGWPYLHWPPLYPLLLAAAGFGVFDPYDVAGPLNAAIFGLTIFVAGQGLRRHIQRTWLVVGAVLAIMLALPLTWVASFAISEPPFILFVTLALFQADKYLERGRRSDLIWAAVFTALAILTRYIGVTLILAIVPLLFLQRGVVPVEKARRIGLYLLIALAPVGLWLVQNALRHGRIDGHRVPSPYNLSDILDKFGRDLAEWVFFYVPSGGVGGAAAVFAAAVLLALAAAVGYTLVRAHRSDKGRDRDDWRPFYLFGGFALVYLAFLTAAQSQTAFHPLGGRHLAPVYIPLLFTAVCVLDRLLGYARESRESSFGGNPSLIRTLVGEGVRRHGLLVLAIVLFGSLWLAGGAALNARAIIQASEHGLGAEGPVWANSEVMQYLREAPADVPALVNSSVTYIYANRPGNDYLSTHLDDIKPKWKPGINFGAKWQIENAADGAYIVWFYSAAPDYEYGIKELPHLEPVAELSDGIIFRINRAAEFQLPSEQ